MLNLKKHTTSLQENLISLFIKSEYAHLKKRSKETYMGILRNFFLGNKKDTKLTQDFILWLSKNKLSIVEKEITPEEIEKVSDTLAEIYGLFLGYSLVNKLGCKIRCGWNFDRRNLEESLGKYKVFSFWVETYKDSSEEEEFSIILTDDNIYNGELEKISVEEIMEFLKEINVVEVKPLSEYLPSLNQ